jgi:hypothetical protein
VSPVSIDGSITPEEWGGADPATAMVLEQGFSAEVVQPRSRAWLSWDGEALLVAIDNEVDVSAPISTGNVWGLDDAVEVAVRNPAAGAAAPILVLRGFPNGHFESSKEAGAPAEAVARALQGVEYKAQSPAAGRWTAEWRIPLASLGVDPATQTRLQFNLSVRKAASDLWVEWQSTGGSTWNVSKAGIIELAP